MPLQAGGMGDERGRCINAIPHVVHSLRADGFDASEDGTGRGTPLVPVTAPCLTQNYGKQPDNSDTSAGPMLVPVAFNLRGREDGAQPEADPDNLAAIRAASGGSSRSYVAFSAKDHGADAGDVSPTLRSGGAYGANGGVMPAVAFAQNQRDEVRQMDVAGALASAVRRLTPRECSRLQGFPDDYLELVYADAAQAHAAQVLHELWKAASAPAGEGRRSGVVASLLTPEVLLAGVHGGWLSWEMAAGCAAARRASQGAASCPEGFVRSLRQAGAARRPPFGRESFEQLARELGSDLSQLPLEGAQARAVLLGSELWPEASALWPLRYAFAAQKAGRAAHKLNPDGPRYKALGNSMAVPVMRWIGERIAQVNQIALAEAA